MTNDQIITFALAVADALREKAQYPPHSHLSSVAEQLEKDITTNLNRALRLAMRVDVAHSLNVPVSWN